MLTGNRFHTVTSPFVTGKNFSFQSKKTQNKQGTFLPKNQMYIPELSGQNQNPTPITKALFVGVGFSIIPVNNPAQTELTKTKLVRVNAPIFPSIRR